VCITSFAGSHVLSVFKIGIHFLNIRAFLLFSSFNVREIQAEDGGGNEMVLMSKEPLSRLHMYVKMTK
jgi:hypothetical protein